MKRKLQNLTNGIKGFAFLDQDLADPTQYTFAIIISTFRDQWVFVRHRDRSTWELPAGHVEPGETVYVAAERELWEETGAIRYDINPIVSYEGIYHGEKVNGMLFFADIKEFGPLPEKEIAEKKLFPAIPEHLTYPGIQPLMIDYFLKL